MITTILMTIAILVIAYYWMKDYRKNQMLKWIPQVPKIPIFGNSLEIGNPADVLPMFSKYLKDNNDLCILHVLYEKFILAADPTFVEFLLGKTDILNKTEEYYYLSSWLGSGLIIAKASKWKGKRKLLTPSFHFSNLDNFLDIFEKRGDVLVDILEKETNKSSFDVCSYITNCTLDIICETAMGVSIDAQKNPKSDYVDLVHKKLQLLIVRTYSAIKRFDISYFFTKDYRLEKKYDQILHDHTLSVISERKKQYLNKEEREASVNDGIKRKKVFLDLLLETRVNGEPLTDEFIREEVDTFMFAGHDTTATAIAFSLYCLSVNQDVQEKVVKEQKQIFGDNKDRAATKADFAEMKYLDLVLKECLRLYPSVPYIGRKTDKEVVYVDGNKIPKDTSILVPIYCINRNPKYFSNPDKFDPSRFEDTTSIPIYTYLPFSAGPRNCIGQKFAWSLMKSLVSKIVRNYEILPCGHEVIVCALGVLRSKNGVKIILKKRNWDAI